MLFHHLFQEKMTVWKQVRFRNPPFSYGSQALFSTIFQENQQKFLLLTVFWWCDDSRNPPWLEWRHFFYIKLQKYNSKIGWQAGGFQISSRRIWWLRCSNILQQVCEWMNKHVDFYHFVEYVLHWIWYLIVRLGIFNYIIAWKWCARKDVWKNRFQMATNNEAAPCGKKSDKKPMLMYQKRITMAGWKVTHFEQTRYLPKRCPSSQPVWLPTSWRGPSKTVRFPEYQIKPLLSIFHP